MTLRAHLNISLVVGALALTGPIVASPVHAQESAKNDEDRAAAQVLFDEGQALTEEGKWKQACEKFEGSQRLDPSIGTQLNLANCFEKLGRTASAWINFHEVSQMSSDRRASFAKEQADRLEPSLVKLHLKIARRVPGMTITRGGSVMEEPTWDEPVPVDPGTFDILVKAPGHAPWRKSVELTEEGETVELKVPALIANPDEIPEPDPDPDPKVAPIPDEGGNGQLIAGAVIGGLGVVGVGIGIGLAVVAHGKNDDSLAFCPSDPNMCFADGVALREDAQSLQAGYVGALVAGGAALVTGVVLIAIASSGSGADTSEGEAWLTLYPGGLGLTGSF